eukprot:1882636-Rhodomonas_salina.1
MRLVTIYKEDDDFSDSSGMNNGGGSTLDSIETSSTGSADYVQVQPLLTACCFPVAQLAHHPLRLAPN